MQRRLKNLGGWWRLWIVVSALWIAGTGAVTLSQFPTDKSVHGTIGGDYPILVSSVPFSLSRAELLSKLERKRKSERDYAHLVEAWLAKKIPDKDFQNRVETIKFRPTKGWKTSDAPPEGAISLDSTPRERLIEWAALSIALCLAIPFGLLAAGLSISWVKEGFQRQRSSV